MLFIPEIISDWHDAVSQQEALRERKLPPRLVLRAWNSLLKHEAV